MPPPLLSVDQLNVNFKRSNVFAVRGVCFELRAGETVGLVGESGSGKTVTAQALIGLLGPDCRVEGEILLRGRNLTTLSEAQWRDIRGREIGMVMQDPMTALNPTMRIGAQIAEGLRRHQRLSRRCAHYRAIELLRRVGISDPDQRAEQYPHEFSGGMRQRVLIAMALACRPSLLIADEPTTALDVTVQAQVLALLKELQEEIGTAILLITHDLGVVANQCDRVLVMYAGNIVETGSTADIFHHAAHPYTRALLAAHPSRKAAAIPGSPPNLAQPFTGCPFASRCQHVMKICTESRPPVDRINGHHRCLCWLHDPRAQKKERQHV